MQTDMIAEWGTYWKAGFETGKWALEKEKRQIKSCSVCKLSIGGKVRMLRKRVAICSLGI